MAGFTYGLAVQSDDAPLRALLDRTPIPGEIELTFRREPSFFLAASAGNDETQTVVCRDAETGELLGFGERSFRRAFVDGAESTVGYLGMLRGAVERRGGLGLARGYRYFRELHAEDPRVPFYLTTILDGFASYAGERADHEGWIAQLRSEEDAARHAESAELESDADPIHPARVYGELRKRLARDAVVIGDGGDFVSYAGKLVDSYEPGCWMDPGPYGCLGTGLGYAVAARVAHPDRQVVLMLGDGAIGFNGMDFDSLVRHGLPVVAIVGNNGIWGLEKHPMQAIYGYDVAADLQPGCRYDDVVKALGGAGETVERPADLGPALDRAFAAGVPYLVNVLTDPANAYPRSSNLA